LRTSTVIKNAGPKKIFPIFPHVAAILAKWSAIGAAIRCMRIHRTTAAYLMKPHSRAVWNKRSILWLSPVSGQAKEFNVNRLKMMLIELTFLSAASARTVVQVAKDAGTPMRGVHEIQVTVSVRI
jgi:hypothetical protein